MYQECLSSSLSAVREYVSEPNKKGWFNGIIQGFAILHLAHYIIHTLSNLLIKMSLEDLEHQTKDNWRPRYGHIDKSLHQEQHATCFSVCHVPF
jgi:hypothetical protein